MNFDRAAILREFIAEAHEDLSSMEQALLVLETNTADREAIDLLFRKVHNLKGNATVLDLHELADFCHALEDRLEVWREGSAPTRGLVTAVLAAVDTMRVFVAESSGTSGQTNKGTNAEAVLARIESEVAANSKHRLLETPLSSSPDTGAPNKVKETRAATVRVPIERLDGLLNLAGEITISRGRLKQQLSVGGNTADLLAAHREADDLLLELQDQLMKLRMVSVGPFFGQFSRMVRDLAVAAGKDIALRIEGEDVEIDMTILENLRAPLTHMLRNAIDHGIEAPDLRSGAGKPRQGQIILRASHDAGNILIEIIDDGAGMNRRRILAQAHRRGLAAADALLDESQILRLVLEPGFSTADDVSKLSGRGVGMDVVNQSVDRLRGSLEIESTEGKGTHLTLRLPLTLAIIEGFAVGVGEEIYVMPLDTVVECMELPLTTDDRLHDVVNLRGKPLPYVRLRHLFDTASRRPERENIVIVQQHGFEAGLVVDSLLGEMQTVIKPLGRLFEKQSAFSASTLLGDGRVALVLDIARLLQDTLAQAEARYAAVETNPTH